jgi:hypothetical protein
VARVVAFVPDLLFGSNVVGALGAAGHDAVLVSDSGGLRRELPDAQILIVDLTTDPGERIELVSQGRAGRVRPGHPALADGARRRRAGRPPAGYGPL